MTRYVYFLVFPSVRSRLNEQVGPYEIVVFRKDNHQVIGRGSPYFHWNGDPEYHRLCIALVKNRDICAPICMDEIDWKVVDGKNDVIQGPKLEQIVPEVPVIEYTFYST